MFASIRKSYFDSNIYFRTNTLNSIDKSFDWLRCPFPDCAAGNKAMKLLVLGLHLEMAHSCLQALLEADSRPGIASALALLYRVKEEPVACWSRQIAAPRPLPLRSGGGGRLAARYGENH